MAAEMAGLLFRLESLRRTFCTRKAIPIPVSLARKIPFLGQLQMQSGNQDCQHGLLYAFCMAGAENFLFFSLI
jgi:hypothetical protein